MDGEKKQIHRMKRYIRGEKLFYATKKGKEISERKNQIKQQWKLGRAKDRLQKINHPVKYPMLEEKGPIQRTMSAIFILFRYI